MGQAAASWDDGLELSGVGHAIRAVRPHTGLYRRSACLENRFQSLDSSRVDVTPVSVGVNQIDGFTKVPVWPDTCVSLRKKCRDKSRSFSVPTAPPVELGSERYLVERADGHIKVGNKSLGRWGWEEWWRARARVTIKR
jgi:hypothetical protein